MATGDAVSKGTRDDTASLQEKEHIGGTQDDFVPDPAMEKEIMRKLDWHILPMVMWIYLMNFMDRGRLTSFPGWEIDPLIILVNIGNARLYGLEADLNMTGEQFQLSVSILFVTYCVRYTRIYAMA